VVVGDSLRVDLEDQIIGRSAGPHYVGQAQVLDDGRLSIELQQTTEAGRTARAFLEDDIVDVVVLPSNPPVVRLRLD
jgi:hypothetical protein